MTTMDSFLPLARGLVVLVEWFKEFSAPKELVKVYANPCYWA